ncbi:TonB-dependent receptor [Croceicoccus sediminis]|uniref:TonB-dependent receptor n=1 Tax=Croceicoccus sediminis TaxID=2571150 RepID=UPI0014790FD5|nr:TonB-dependent receptor [Croceicoccus sediminis]
MNVNLKRNRGASALGKAILLAGSATLLAPVSAAAQDAAAGSSSQASGGDVNSTEIVVTATRRTTPLSRTPLSVTAKGQEELDVQGVRSIADIASITPGVSFGQSAIAYGTGQTIISIRGVDSQSGIPTTGVYIDNTPIQTRVGVSPSLGNAYPQIFDLERVEVLRGPQGTLFGSGSVGGAIRFITPEPNYDDVEIYSRAELATTKHGSESYEAGLAGGAPLVEDKIGMRLSVWGRHDGGYIDRLDPYTGELVEKDSDYTNSFSARLALGFRLGENVTLTPSIYYQRQYINDGSRFELETSDIKSGNLRQGLNQRNEPHHDRFVLPALKAELELGGVSITSETSYFDRRTDTINDDTSLSYVFSGGLTGRPFPAGFEDYSPSTRSDTKQELFTQELRMQDNDETDRLSWIFGLFYQKSKVYDQFLASDPRLLDVLNLFQEAVGEAPFPSLTESFFGTELYQGQYSVATRNEHRDQQYAAYGQADYEIIDGLKATVGLRYTIADYEFTGFNAGPVLATDGTTDTADTTSKTLTPKFGLSYQADRNNLFYASASKGVRGPGVSPPVGANCIDDAAAIGFDPFATLEVDPDSIWSYEVGSKNRLFGGKLAIDASAYHIDWSNVQTLFALPQCTIQTALNLGEAKIDGFDVALSARPVDGLTLGAAVAYIDARYTSAIPGPDDTVVRKSGEPFPLVSPWTVQANAEYRYDMAGGETYARADFSYSSKIDQPVDVDSPLVDPTLPRPPATSVLDLRLGHRFVAGSVDVDASLFINNVTDERPLLALFHETPDSTFYRAGTFRPRTVGVTLTVTR